ASAPWYLRFAATLTEEEYATEQDWIVPTILRYGFIVGGHPGYPLADGNDGLADHPDIAPLWRAWHAAYHHVSHEITMRRMDGPCRDLYDFWSRRDDPPQEQLRQQLVEGLLGVMSPTAGKFLTAWKPSDPAKCTTYPSERYWKWEQETGED